MSLYSVVLYAHSYLRWAVLLALPAVVVRSFIAQRRGRAWESGDERLHRAALGLVDLQFTLGLALYVWLSPITKAFWGEPGRAMKDSVLRFFGLEHVTLMLLGVALVHVGRKRSTKAPAAHRHRTVARFTLAGCLLMLAGVPWPFLKSPRPLARGFGDSASAPRATAAGATSCPPAFHTRCATCHGEKGLGDGVAAVALNPPPRNFSDASLRDKADTALAAVIREGGAKHGLSVAMPAHSDLSDDDVVALVRCVRSFGASR
jgi:mono/diheme cytochrome c family protein